MEINIDFEEFKHQFYLNNCNKIPFSVDNDPNIYDIHHLLLDLLIYGIELLNLDIYNQHIESLEILQKFYNNINIIININNFSKYNLIDNELYPNRYMKFDTPNNMIINGSHNTVNELSKINSFYLIDDKHNFCINFSYI